MSKTPISKSKAGNKTTPSAAKKAIKSATRSVPAKPASGKKAAVAKKPVAVAAKKAAAKAPAVFVKKSSSAKSPAPAQKTAAVKKVVPVKKAPAKPQATKTAPVKAVVKKQVAEVKPTPTQKVAAKVAKPAAPVSKAGAKKTVTAEPPPAAVVKVVEPTPPAPAKEKVKPAGSALYYDSHMHTPLCKHAWGEPEEYAAQGLKSGLRGIIFTCHCPMPDGYWPSVRMADSEFDLYVQIVQRAAQAYSGKLDVCLGLESEFFPGCEPWIEKLHKRADFDYILGGVHWQAKEYLAKYEVGTIENFRRTYFEHLAQSAESGLYDCLAHPDLVKNYHPDSWCFAIIKNTVEGVLDRIAKTGVAMEMNTSGLNKSYSEMNPGNEMLRMMAERGIPIVIGSDAHRANRVGEHFITALNNLADSGFEEVSYFQKRQRVSLKISEVIASIRRATDANI